jgi:pimeloyl-ACP methyl ester carboxylesterase
MTGPLGYSKYVAQGGDWGAFVTSALARAHGGTDEGVVAIHLNLFTGGPGDTAAQQEYLRRMGAWQGMEGGYAHLQATKPLTIGHALADSPAGLAAWIVEKFHTWSDCDGDVESVFSKDELLTNIMLYWLGGTISTSVRLYQDMALEMALGPETGAAGPISTATAFAAFPKEFAAAPREVVGASFNLQRYTEFPRGGHFAALEQPDALVTDIREFCRPYRAAAAN